MSLFTHPEGPPSEEDMRHLAFDLLYANKIDDAHKLAATMVEHWLDMPAPQREEDHSRYFNYWLGIKSTTAHIAMGRRHRASHLTSRRSSRRRHA